MQLSKLIAPERVRVPLLGTDKRAVITELVDLMAQTGALTDRDAALEAIMKREAERSTGLGYGLAIPHGKCAAVAAPVMAAGKPAVPVDFQSLDKRPVTFVVLLVSPNGGEWFAPHVQALSHVSRLMSIEGFRAAVATATTAAELHAAIVAYESGESA